MSQAQERPVQLFEFLRGYNAHRNPIIRTIRDQPKHLWFKDLPEHKAITLGQPAESSGDEANDQRDAFFLRVKRPKLTDAPNPPKNIKIWLERGWEDAKVEKVKRIESQNEVEADGTTNTILFSDDPKRVEVFEAWIQKRDQWREAELPALKAWEIYSILYEWHNQLNRDAEKFELILGDGIFSWLVPNEKNAVVPVHHPILHQRVRLSFNTRVPEFTLEAADDGIEFYHSLFQSIPNISGESLKQQKDLVASHGHNINARDWSVFLKQFCPVIDKTCNYISDALPPAGSDVPQVGRSLVFFMRKRALGFDRAIESIIDSIKEGGYVSPAINNIAGVEAAPQWGAVDAIQTERENADRENAVLDDQHILFGKPANPEQFSIAKHLRKHHTVLVQGPPGTGKSHTIANLIGDLLAQGKSILVTSEKAKALAVLREHIVEDLRPLCVTNLADDEVSRNQLEESVKTIKNRFGEDPAGLEKKAAQQEKRRNHLIASRSKQQTLLSKALRGEYLDVVFGGTSYSPSDAARTVSDRKELDGWIPGPVALGAALPLSGEEVTELYQTNDQTTDEDITLVDDPLPPIEDLITPDEFEKLLSEIEKHGEAAETFAPDLWEHRELTEKQLENLEMQIDELKSELETFHEMDQWQLAAVNAGYIAGAAETPWRTLCEVIQRAELAAGSAKVARIEYEPSFPPRDLGTQLEIAEEIVAHLEGGGNLGMFALLRNSQWKEWLHQWKVNGRKPTKLEHFRALASVLKAEIAIATLKRFWDAMMPEYGLPKAKDFPNDAITYTGQFVTRIESALEWWKKKVKPAIDKLKDIGFKWDDYVDHLPPSEQRLGAISHQVEAVGEAFFQLMAAAYSHFMLIILERRLLASEELLARYTRPEPAAALDALKKRITALYREAFEAIKQANVRQRHAKRRLELLAKLEAKVEWQGTVESDEAASQVVPVAAGWASAIENRQAPHGAGTPPGVDIERAWTWRQLNDELDFRSQIDMVMVSRKIEGLTEQLNECTNQLIETRTWAELLKNEKRTGPEQKRALAGWLQTEKKIGKGYGKRAASLRVEARHLMSQCRAAVPVWVMPLSRVAHAFDCRRDLFDVVIIDEASQLDSMGLIAFAIARQVLIVGDDEQVSPLAIGQRLAVVEALIATFLKDVPNKHLFDGQQSIYDLAAQNSTSDVTLLEHFRCMPDIIQFSNHLSYHGNIKPLRDSRSGRLKNHVIEHRVESHDSLNNVNHPEATVITSLIAAICEAPEYLGLTIGVISMKGDDQAMQIDTLLRKYLNPIEYEQRRLVCGNASQFQGDERDVMFLSVVDAAAENPPLPMSQQHKTQQRFNVAASRARDQMWVVHSLNDGDLKPGDLRARLIAHAQDPRALTRHIEEAENKTESEFERQVLSRLLERGYRVTPQWKVGSYRIDLVVECLVEGQPERLAVECDGDRYHTLDDLPKDLERQAILERLGWRFHRIRGSEYFRDNDGAMNRLFARLDEMGIEPSAEEEEPTSSAASDVTDRIRRRAAEIRAEWLEAERPQIEQEQASDAAELDADRALFRESLPASDESTN